MKKRIKTALLLLACLVLLAACGESEIKPLVENPELELGAQVERISALVVSLGGLDGKQLSVYDDMLSDEMDSLTDFIKQQYGLYVDFSVVLEGAHSYQDVRELLNGEWPEGGSGQQSGNELEYRLMNEGLDPSITSLFDAGAVEYDVDEDSVIVEAHFKTLRPEAGGHDGVVEIIYDKNLHITSVTVNTVLELGESMQRAATNTLIGMGTVFIMLILIALIISLLKYIPGAVEGVRAFFKGEGKSDTEDSVDKAIAGIVEREEAQQAGEADDTELIAVIAAAIAAFSGGSSADGFVVRSIKRIR